MGTDQIIARRYSDGAEAGEVCTVNESFNVSRVTLGSPFDQWDQQISGEDRWNCTTTLGFKTDYVTVNTTYPQINTLVRSLTDCHKLGVVWSIVILSREPLTICIQLKPIRSVPSLQCADLKVGLFSHAQDFCLIRSSRHQLQLHD